MAKIPQIVAKRSLDPATHTMPRPEFGGFKTSARALQSLGSAISGLGNDLTSVAAKSQQRQEQLEDFKAEQGFRQLQLDLAGEMSTRQGSMEADGAGFHQAFMADVYRPRRDAFLEGLPPRLQERFQFILTDPDEQKGTPGGVAFEEWANKSAAVERDQGYKFFREGIDVSSQQLATAIRQSPEQYDALLQQGYSLIDASGLPELEKHKMRRSWEQMAQVAHLDNLIETDPLRAVRELGVDLHRVPPQTQFSMLRAAVIGQESGGGPLAVSPKGALGLMQVMPATAAEIAREIGDRNFPTSREAIHSYLTNPEISTRYGSYYLQKQLQRYQGNPRQVEAALIAYNGGPGRADAWVASGYDYDILPKETREYPGKVLARIGYSFSPTMGATPAVGRVAFEFKHDREIDSTGKLSPILVDRVNAAFSGLGISSIKVNSGYRDPETNEKAGGVRGSQHLHGNAIDINVSGYATEKRIEIIRALSRAGITGIGVGANIIHADIGRRRAWGYRNGQVVDAVPSWATNVVAEHVSGTVAAAPAHNANSGSPRFASMDYDRRAAYINKIDTALDRQEKARNTRTDLEKFEVRNAMQNELAMVRETGSGDVNFDASNIATVLGDAAYAEFQQKREVARRTFLAADDFKTMPQGEIEERMASLKPVAGSQTFFDDTLVYANAAAEADRIARKRAKHPGDAALEDPAIQDVHAKLVAKAKDEGVADSALAKELVRKMTERQLDFGTPKDAVEPVPKSLALSIGRGFVNLPSAQAGDRRAFYHELGARYAALYQIYGEYTDEVIMYALQVYQGIGETDAARITSTMRQINTGRPTPPGFYQGARSGMPADQELDLIPTGGNDRPQELSLWDRITNMFGSDENREDAAYARSQAEQRIRENSLTDED